MNIHPIFVHFPVALLTIYSICELIRFKRLNNSSEWFYVKAVFLILGVAGAFAALLTGDMAKQFHRDVRQLVQAHEFFAQTASFIFGVLALNYIVIIADSFLGWKLLSWFGRLWVLILKIRKSIFSAPVLVSLALLGFIILTITGALGGAIAYGPTVDPLASLLTKLLRLQ